MRRSALVIGVVLMMSAAGGVFGGVVLYGQIKGLRTELAGAKRELAGTKDRLARLERRVDSPQQSVVPNEAAGAARPQLAIATPLELTREEAQLVRDYIKLPPAPPGTQPTILLGAAVADAVLMPLPPQITDKFPRLLGARFTTDRNGAIVIVRRGSRSADAVITPQN